MAFFIFWWFHFHRMHLHTCMQNVELPELRWNKLNDETIPWVSSCSLLISPVLTSLEIVASLSLCKGRWVLSAVSENSELQLFLWYYSSKSLPSFLFASYRKSILSIGADFTYSPLCFIFFALMMLLIILLGFHCRVLSKE